MRSAESGYLLVDSFAAFITAGPIAAGVVVSVFVVCFSYYLVRRVEKLREVLRLPADELRDDFEEELE